MNKENNKLCGYELNTYTYAGVNQIVFIDFRGTKLNPRKSTDFIYRYNQTIERIDIDEEVNTNRQDPNYTANFTLSESVQDFTEWKVNLLNIFNDKTPQQRQFEQVVDKFRTQLQAMQETLELMPIKGNISADCQKTLIGGILRKLETGISGIELEDFTPNEYSGDFKLSYS